MTRSQVLEYSRTSRETGVTHGFSNRSHRGRFALGSRAREITQRVTLLRNGNPARDLRSREPASKRVESATHGTRAGFIFIRFH